MCEKRGIQREVYKRKESQRESFRGSTSRRREVGQAVPHDLRTWAKPRAPAPKATCIPHCIRLFIGLFLGLITGPFAGRRRRGGGGGGEARGGGGGGEALGKIGHQNERACILVTYVTP